jgi:hypothetical protein
MWVGAMGERATALGGMQTQTQTQDGAPVSTRSSCSAPFT